MMLTGKVQYILCFILINDIMIKVLGPSVPQFHFMFIDDCIRLGCLRNRLNIPPLMQTYKQCQIINSSDLLVL